MSALEHYYGQMLLMRTPAPLNVNKAGANYKSEVAYPEYSPRAAYLEWLSICEGFRKLNVDVIFDFESDDEIFLDQGHLSVDAGGVIHNGNGPSLGTLESISTGRVFTANGPWVIREGNRLRALMPHMLPHRLQELPYFEHLLTTIAQASGCTLEIERNPHRWEGLADVSVIGDRAIFTYTTFENYAPLQAASGQHKTLRSSLEGVQHASAWAGFGSDAACYAELVYPHFHGDTAHFALVDGFGRFHLAQYSGALFQNDLAHLRNWLNAKVNVLSVEQADAVDAYATNTRFVWPAEDQPGVLIPSGCSAEFIQSLTKLGLQIESVALFELFGKAGGGPACASLYLPKNLNIPTDFSKRYSVRREEAQCYANRLAKTVTVDPAYFAARPRG